MIPTLELSISILMIMTILVIAISASQYQRYKCKAVCGFKISSAYQPISASNKDTCVARLSPFLTPSSTRLVNPKLSSKKAAILAK